MKRARVDNYASAADRASFPRVDEEADAVGFQEQVKDLSGWLFDDLDGNSLKNALRVLDYEAMEEVHIHQPLGSSQPTLHQACMSRISDVLTYLKAYRVLEMDDESVLKMIRRAVLLIKRSHELLFHAVLHASTQDPKVPLPSQTTISLMVQEYAEMSVDDDLSDAAMIHEYLYALASKNGYKKRDGYLYRPLFNGSGEYVYAMEMHLHVSEFVNKEINSIDTKPLWNAMVAKGSREKIIKDLAEIEDPRLPRFAPQRRVFSFRNGLLFLGRRCMMTEEEERGRRRAMGVNYSDEGVAFFKPFNHPSIPQSLVAANYFDMDFDEAWLGAENPMTDIPTPVVDSIFKFQDMDDDVLFYLYALTGRMVLYPLRMFDHWQVAPFFFGYSRTGKGTYGQYLMNVYPPGLCCIMGNQSEERFGLDAYKDMYFMVGMEIKKDFTMDEANFNSLISGEGVEIQRKHKMSVTIPHWMVPMLMCGNETPGFDDSGGCMGNRLVFFLFRNAVIQQNSHLPAEMKREIGAFLIKIFLCYMTLLENMGARGFYDPGFAPSYFHDARNHVQAQSDPFRDFLESEKVIFDRDLNALDRDGKLEGVPEEVRANFWTREDGWSLFYPKRAFMAALKEHCSENVLKTPRFNAEQHGIVLKKYRCKYGSKGERRTYHGGHKTAEFISGCDKRSNFEDWITED